MTNLEQEFSFCRYRWFDSMSSVQKVKVSKICGEYNIEINTFLARIHSNLTINEAITIPCNRRNLRDKIIKEVSSYDGCTYKTVKEIYSKYNLTRQTLYTRYNSGFPIKVLLSPVKNKLNNSK